MHLSFSTFSLTRCCVDSTSVCEDHVLSTTTIPRLSWRISAVRLLFLSVENENTMIRFFFPNSRRRPTFIPRPPGPPVGGAKPGGRGIAGLIGGLAAPLLCFGCLASLAILGLFATMIGAATYMSMFPLFLVELSSDTNIVSNDSFDFSDRIQGQIRKLATGGSAVAELNISVLFCALFCTVYILSKHRRGIVITN